MRNPFSSNRRCPLRVLLGLLSAFFLPSTHAQTHQGKELVRADLVADTAAIAPGRPFTVGLRLRMAPRWHTYWQYAGDAGLPTKITWSLPPGFTAGPIQWPIPDKLESPGDIINYGYEGEVVLLTTLTPPAQLPPGGEVTLKAKADWLVCEDICIPGGAALALKLPVGGGDAAEANAGVFTKYRALLPRAGREAAALSAVERRTSGNDLLLTFKVATPASDKFGLDFFPLPAADVEVGHPVSPGAAPASGGTTATFKLPIVTGPAGADKVGGVLVVTSADGDRIGYVVPPGGTHSVGSASPEPVTSAKPVDPTERVSPTAAAPPATPNPPPTPGGSLGRFLLLGLLGGLILNVMPCVLPVISLKIFSFVQQANVDPARVWRLGLAYVAGIFAWFLGFAGIVIALKAAGREVGYAFHFQNPYFLVGLSAVVFVFALSLLGVFEVVLPGAVTDAAASGATRREGAAGAFFQGVLATVLASACTAPVFGAALGFAFAQSAPVILAMFAAIALGMGLPFLLLAARPGWLRFLPKPGAWMERVKQLTGFAMLATVLWLLYVLGALRGADAVIWAGVGLLALAIAAWTQGNFNTPFATARSRWLARAAILLLALGGGALALNGVAASRRPGTALADGAGTGTFSDRLQAALTGGKPVFVDFTAEWCVNCKVNEKTVLATEPVQRALRERDAIFLKADWTDGAPDITKLLRGFGRAGVPLYVVYPAGKPDAPVVLPELLTQGLVLDALAEADRRAGVAAPKPVAAR